MGAVLLSMRLDDETDIGCGKTGTNNRAVWIQNANKDANIGKLFVSEGVQVNGLVFLDVTEVSTSRNVVIPEE